MVHILLIWGHSLEDELNTGPLPPGPTSAPSMMGGTALQNAGSVSCSSLARKVTLRPPEHGELQHKSV